MVARLRNALGAARRHLLWRDAGSVVRPDGQHAPINTVARRMWPESCRVVEGVVLPFRLSLSNRLAPVGPLSRESIQALAREAVNSPIRNRT